MEIVRLIGVTKSYTGIETALKEVSFTIKHGEFAALAGPSGSGKTTILNLAAGLDEVSAGKIVLCNKDLSKMSTADVASLRRKMVGFVFQAYNLFPVLTALENVMYPLALNHVSPRERKERGMAALKDIGLEELAHRMPKELSGGQQQRVAIARAIVNRPAIVFADEPTANVDSTNAIKILDLFNQLNEQKGITFLFSSHDPRVLERANRILHVGDGTVQREEKKTPLHAVEAIAA